MSDNEQGMLILTRNPGQRIIFQEAGIEIVLLGFKAGQARIGIRAPKDVNVVRNELIGVPDMDVSGYVPTPAKEAAIDRRIDRQKAFNKLKNSGNRYDR